MLRSLESETSLPLSFDPLTGTIRWPADIHIEHTNTRTFTEMRPLLADPHAESDREIMYTMYRSVARASDLATIQAAGLRYDITIIPPGSFVGRSRKEFFKTAGHYHPLKPGTNIAYPEVYEVLSGRAYWVIQRPGKRHADHIDEVYLIEAGPGEKALLPPGFGHVAVNAYAEPLILANWVNTTFTYDYATYHEHRGAAYWALEGPGPDIAEFEPNPHYASVPDLQKIFPKELPAFGFIKRTPLYELIRDFDKLRFLSDPEDFAHLLAVEHCYRIAEDEH